MLHDIIQLDPGIFRAYDIRGIVGESLTEESVFLIGKAIGTYVREEGGRQICVGRDGRYSGPQLSKALIDGILAVGCDVIDVGMVPTPVLYFAAFTSDEHSGVMLTGSHNPANYNGLKIVVHGKTLALDNIQRLYQYIAERKFTDGFATKYTRDVVQEYIDQVASNVKLARPLKIVVDAGNGVTGMMAPQLFKALGCDVHPLFCEVDGYFPNHHPDPTQPENLVDLINAVKEQNADIGLAFDGDGDRLGMVTKLGEIINPDRILMLFAQSVLAKIPAAKIIYDVKCTNHLATLIQEQGGEPIMWKTGHSLIKAKMAETKAQLAGEMSGHFFFKDRWYGFDDALYAGARLLDIVADKPSDVDVFATIPNSVNTPELKVKVLEEEKFALMDELINAANFIESHDLTTIDGLRVNFAEGWGLVRPSNTTPYLIVRFEAGTESTLLKIQRAFKDWMLSVKPDLVLPF